MKTEQREKERVKKIIDNKNKNEKIKTEDVLKQAVKTRL
jgi:hypothetical protein